jgi:hypothetical protein
MSCERARGLDLSAYLIEPDSTEWSAFRAHFPVCPDCSSVLASWTTLEDSLRAWRGAGRTSRHPEPSQLAAFEGDPRSLSAEQWSEIQHHLDGCRRCADELAALRTFDFAALAAGAPVRTAEVARALGRSLLAGARALADSARALREGGTALLQPEPAVAPQSAPEARSAPKPMAVLIALGELAGQVFPLFEGEARLGRGPDCELRLQHDALPRVAARIRVSADACEIEWLAARPQLRVNGEESRRAALRDGDRIRLAGEEFELRRVGT